MLLWDRENTVDVYCCGIYNCILELDPFAPLDKVTKDLSNSLYNAATRTQWEMNPTIQTNLYDEEYRDTRRCLDCDVTRGIYTYYSQTSKRNLPMSHEEEEEILFN